MIDEQGKIAWTEGAEKKVEEATVRVTEAGKFDAERAEMERRLSGTSDERVKLTEHIGAAARQLFETIARKEFADQYEFNVEEVEPGKAVVTQNQSEKETKNRD